LGAVCERAGRFPHQRWQHDVRQALFPRRLAVARVGFKSQPSFNRKKPLAPANAKKSLALNPGDGEGEMIVGHRIAKLVKRGINKYELVDGTTEDRAKLKKWIALFMKRPSH
jgi:hypothetical protein